MVKLCPIFIIATTVIILMSFGVLCYLLRTINPKPIPENARKHDSVGSNPVRFINHNYNMKRYFNIKNAYL